MRSVYFDISKLAETMGRVDVDVFDTFEYEDAHTIAEIIVKEGGVLFSYTPDRKTVHNIFISDDYLQAGRLHFGSDTRGSTIVGILGHGFFWFDLSQDIYSSYIAEKLNLPKKEAKLIAKLLNEVAHQLGKTSSRKHSSIPTLQTVLTT